MALDDFQHELDADEKTGPDFRGPGSNTGTDKQNIRDEFEHDPFDWATLVGQNIALDMGYWADLNGEQLGFVEQMYGQFASGMFDAIYSQLFVAADTSRQNAPALVKGEIARGEANPEEYGVMGMGSQYYTQTLKGMQEMVDFARNWMSTKTGFDLVAAPRSGGSRGRGGGGGRSGPTEEDLRNQFDLDELAEGINNMNRGLVLEEHADAKGLARKYVDAIVATKGEKKIDFETYVRGKIEGTSRFKNIYAHKPESVSAEAYIQPYLQAAMQMGTPDEAAEVAIGGAQFGASAESFRQRLNRTENATGSAPYINQLEARMNNVSSVLRG